MFKHVVVYSAIIGLLFTTCRPFIRFQNEAEIIRYNAEQLLKETEFLFPSVRDAASLAVLTIQDSFRRTVKLDRKAALFAATATATLIADEAVKTIVLKEVKKLDAIFSIDRSEEIAAMLLSSYCFPALNEVITAVINYYSNRIDPSSMPDDLMRNIETIIGSHLKRITFEDAIEIIEGFGTEQYTPEYLSGVGMKDINTDRYCATRNWKDNGLVYQYRINDSAIEMKRGDDIWRKFDDLPFNAPPISIAADNNRFTVLTADHAIWWYCVKDDQAQWSIDIMNRVVDFMSLTPIIKGQVCETMLPLMIGTMDSITALASSMKNFKHWKKMFAEGDGSSSTYWTQRCAFFTDAVLSIDRMLLKAANGSTFTAADYAEWSKRSHATGSWSNLLSWTSGDQSFFRGGNLSPESIIDIAIGNWNSTVSTTYVLADGKVWFIDEEIIQAEWRPIEQWNDQWAIIGKKEYHPITNAPYPLDSTCRIDASNSVVAVLKCASDTSQISWIRWDFHQMDDFIYLPVDWCEHEWHTVACPRTMSGDFRINTCGTLDPRKKGTVWSIPAPEFTFYNYLPVEGYEGMFGQVPRTQVSAYPVDLFIRIAPDTLATFSVNRVDKMSRYDSEWKRVPLH